jgi:hypothetical protein
MQHSSVKPVCEAARRLLDELARGLAPGGERNVREPSGVHMPLFVRRLDDCDAGSCFAFGHYHEGRTGTVLTLVPDPEVQLLRAPSGKWTPLSYRTPLAAGAAVIVAAGSVSVVDVAGHSRLVKLVDVWMVNVKANLLVSDLPAKELCAASSYAAG